MNLRDNVVSQKIVTNTVNRFKKYAEEISEVVASDYRLLRAIFNTEDFLKLAVYSDKAKLAFRIQDKGKNPGAPSKLIDGFAGIYVKLLREATHSEHFQYDDKKRIRDQFSKEIYETLKEFYPLAFYRLEKNLPKEIAKMINEKYGELEYTLQEGTAPGSKNVIDRITRPREEGKTDKYKEALEGFKKKGSLPDTANAVAVSGKKRLWKVEGVEADDNLYIRGKPVGGVGSGNVSLFGDDIHEKISDVVQDLLIHYLKEMKEDPVEIKNLILDATYGEERDVIKESPREKSPKIKSEGKLEDKKKEEEKKKTRPQVSEVVFKPRYTKEEVEEKLKELREEHGLPKDTPVKDIPGSKYIGTDKVNKDIIEILSQIEEFEIKALGIEEGSGRDLTKRLTFTISDPDVHEDFPQIDKNRKFVMPVPESIGDIPLGETYTISTRPLKENDKAIILEYKDFKEQMGQSRFETIVEKGLNPKEIRNVTRKLIDNYIKKVIPKMNLDDLVSQFSGDLIVDGKKVYDSESLVDIISDTTRTRIDKSEAIEEYERMEKEEEEAEEAVSDIWGPGGKAEELVSFTLSQGAKQPGLVKTIASQFPKVPRAKGYIHIVNTKPFVQWVLKLIASEKMNNLVDNWSALVSVIMNELTSGKAFNDPEMESVLEFVISNMQGNNWRNDLKKESQQVGEQGGDPKQFIKEKINEYVAEAKKAIRANASAIKRELHRGDFRKNLQKAVFNLIQNKNPYVMGMLQKSGYKGIIEKLMKEKKEPEKEDAKPEEEKKPAKALGALQSDLVSAFMDKNIEKMNEVLTSAGAKPVSEKKAERIKKFRIKTDNYEELPYEPKRFLEGELKKLQKAVAKQASMKVASNMLDFNIESQVDEIYRRILSGCTFNSVNPSLVKLVHQYKRG